jgi:hypothetical protein
MTIRSQYRTSIPFVHISCHSHLPLEITDSRETERRDTCFSWILGLLPVGRHRGGAKCQLIRVFNLAIQLYAYQLCRIFDEVVNYFVSISPG